VKFKKDFDVIVVGGGHAGTEAALASARSGANTLLLTQNIETLGQMSCNPAIGGIGKGHLVKEIDALGGIMAKAIDLGGIQFRTLNASKGPAVRATRAQADRLLYKQAVRYTLENQPNLALFQQTVADLIVVGNQVCGVKTQMGLNFMAKAVVLTTGTFLGGKIHIGLENYSGGRAGDPASIALADRLRELPFRIDRLKTGTPPRIDGRTIDFSKLEEQHGDDPVPVFSFMGRREQHPRQIPCHITRTNSKTHDIIRAGLDRSPLYSGVIEGIGPRYCPSIEDKIVRFADRDTHQIFVEPEGLDTHEIYPNGISTSLPFDVQYEFVRSMLGFENAEIVRPGYAIEYDFFDPRDLKMSLETKHMNALFFAGQVNGTTGYEEAACQGLMAGINAHQKTRDLDPFILKRSEAYIGVLIDDLISKGTDEPYRMFTSRAEFRTLLRQDNADIRLTERSYNLGLASSERLELVNKKVQSVQEIKNTLNNFNIDAEGINPYLESIGSSTIIEKQRATKIILRPNVSLKNIIEEVPSLKEAIGDANIDSLEQAEIQIKYERYIEKELELVNKMSLMEDLIIPENFDYEKVSAVSKEALQKFKKVQPRTLGQASRISGVNPSDVQILMVYMGR